MLQFLKPLAFYIITEYNFNRLKGDIMSKRVYHLTIEYDKDTEEIEYIVEERKEQKIFHQAVFEVTECLIKNG